MRETSGTGLILGIESSCDETAAAVVRSGTAALSNVARQSGLRKQVQSKPEVRHQGGESVI